MTITITKEVYGPDGWDELEDEEIIRYITEDPPLFFDDAKWEIVRGSDRRGRV